MLLARLAEASTALAAVSSRNAKRAILAEVLACVPTASMPTAVSYLSGALRQRRTGLGWTALKSVPEPTAEASLTLEETDAAFAAISHLEGPGSVAARTEAANQLFARATEVEQRFLLGLIMGELRQGALDSLVAEGLAAAFGVPVAAVRRAAMLLGSTRAAAVRVAAGGEQALAAVGLTIGVAVQPMLAASAPDVHLALDKLTLPVVADFKLDGVRVQVHRNGEQVLVFTRSLDDITDRLPEVVAAVRALPADQLVLDGEVMAVGPDGRPAAFQLTASRTASRVDPSAGAQQTALPVFFFDLLHLDGADLLDAPLAERMEVMQRLLPAQLMVPRRVCTGEQEVVDVFGEAVHRGYEGLVIKKLDAGYAAGRRDAGWTKIKPRHTFDLVVLAAEWGHGRRAGLLSNLHLAARDGDEWVMLGKTFKGLTDELLRWQTRTLLELETRRTRGTVFVEPSIVVEIACDGIQTSSRYPGGIALRFARVLRYRADKGAAEADTLDTVRKLAPVVNEALPEQ